MYDDALPDDERLRALIAQAPPHLNRREAAEFVRSKLNLPCTKNQLQRLACVGGGPEYTIYGNQAVYQPPKLVDWCMARFRAPRRSTSEAA